MEGWMAVTRSQGAARQPDTVRPPLCGGVRACVAAARRAEGAELGAGRRAAA